MAQYAQYQIPREYEEWYMKYWTGENPFISLHTARLDDGWTWLKTGNVRNFGSVKFMIFFQKTWQWTFRLHTVAEFLRSPTTTSIITKVLCVIWGFRQEVDENWALLGCYTVSSGDSLPTLRDGHRSLFRDSLFGFLTHEDGTDSLSPNVGKKLTLLAV